ncbi:hypothetical protein ElyMa_001145300 [Elysia marginata]|uniref:Spondin domain-containing protein n=1 Tax=Elysia marginata TaxID=1093978 RepID=A0AAV4HYJ6_9GAST|nr:hypothetical protein ElyMa_001145300 [Elysia marginata]
MSENYYRVEWVREEGVWGDNYEGKALKASTETHPGYRSCFALHRCAGIFPGNPTLTSWGWKAPLLPSPNHESGTHETVKIQTIRNRSSGDDSIYKTQRPE